MFNLRLLRDYIFVKKIFKSFTIYTGASFVNQAIPFLLLPILTRFLTPYDYGILATFMAMVEKGMCVNYDYLIILNKEMKDNEEN